MDVANLIHDLTAGNSAVRAAAAEQLAHLEKDAQPAAVPLVGAVGDEDESVREWATAALESLGPPQASDAAVLAKLLSDPRRDVAYWAAMLLGQLGGSGLSSGDSIIALIGALNSHPQIVVRQQAAWALGEIGCSASSAVDALNQAATNPDPRLARLAQQAIAKIK